MRWPNNARIAVLPQLGLEAFAGDHIEPSPIGLPPKGVTNINGKAWVDYGGRVGAWRVLELFRRHQLPATTLMSALAVERWPAFATTWVAACNEIAGHAYAQDTRMHALTVEDECGSSAGAAYARCRSERGL